MPSPLKNRVSLSEVANRAGASPATVSRVLNGSIDVSAEMQERVRRAVSELGYKARQSQSNGRRRTDNGTVGFLAENESFVIQNDFHHRFLAGIEAKVNDSQRHLMFAFCQDDIIAGRMPPMVEEKLVRGIILKCADVLSCWDWLQRLNQRVPVVLLMQRGLDPSVSSVMCDNEGGVFQTLRYLRELGHSRVGFLSVRDISASGEMSNLHNQQRLEAFRRLSQEFGFEDRLEFVQDVERYRPQDSLEKVIGGALDIWLKMGKDRPTAVVCSADTYAATLIEEAGKRDLKLPRDLSITGFMNTVECELLRPSLTSVSLSGEEMGRVAVELLDQRINHPDSPPRRIVVGSRLVERLSCSKN